MAPHSLEEQLIKYLTDAHSIECQALVQMRIAPHIASDTEIASHFSEHLHETEEHERLMRDRLEATGAERSLIKDAAGAVSGAGFALFAMAQPDTPGKLVAHAYSYEHMELAAYDLLGRVAFLAGDPETARVARQIEEQERSMARRLASSFDRAAEASLRDVAAGDLAEQLKKYLADAHAIEEQAIRLLEKGPKLAGAGELAGAYEEHLAQTQRHEQLVGDRLRARGERPSKLKDAALALGGLNWGTFFAAQPDTPAKLAAFAYAFEHLEIAAYELLSRVAQITGDQETTAMAAEILEEERAAASGLHSLLGEALDASLHEQGVGVR
jgi:ferritin-like metal-binding protein YciE